jgi:hypothetical protein
MGTTYDELTISSYTSGPTARWEAMPRPPTLATSSPKLKSSARLFYRCISAVP